MTDAPVDLSVEADTEPGGALREAMRLSASPVVVVTTEVDGVPRGATIGSFTSVSLQPPLVSLNATLGSGIEGALSEASAFAVHLLAAGQADLAAHFARPDLEGEAQFTLVAHRRAEGEPPRLEGALATLVCRPYARFEAGDHALVIGEVVRVEAGSSGLPLVYHARAYTTTREGGGPGEAP